MKGYESCVVTTKAKNKDERLCLSCQALFECRIDRMEVKFGNVCNVIECSGYIPAVEEKRIPPFVFCALLVALIIAIFVYIFF